MKNHMESLEEIEAANTQTEKVRLQKKYGAQYSELCRLPYFDIIRNHVIDPMHNMYLGTAKHMIKVWKESGLLRQEHLPVIQQKLDEMNVPYGVRKDSIQSLLKLQWSHSRSMVKLDKFVLTLCTQWHFTSVRY